MKLSNIIGLGLAAGVLFSGYLNQGAKTYTANDDLCKLPEGTVENVVGEVLSIEDASVPFHKKVIVGSPASACTVQVTFDRSDMGFSVGDLLKIKGVSTAYGVTAEEHTVSPSLAYDMEGNNGSNVVALTFEKSDLLLVDGRTHLYKLISTKGDLYVEQNMIDEFLRIRGATPLKVTYDRNKTVTSFEVDY